MVTAKKATGKAMSMPGGLALGAGVSIGITLILSAIIAKLVDSEAVSEQGIGYGALITLFASTIMGAIISTSRIKRQRMLVCLLSGVLYYIMLLGVTALFFGGQYSGMGITGLVVAGGSITVALLGKRERKGKGRGSRKWGHR